MADARQKTEEPEPEPAVEAPRAATDKDRKETDNPGEGSFMFSDWALI